MNRLSLFVFASILLPLFACTGQPQEQQAPGFERLEAEAFEAKMKELGEYQLLDVRTDSEYAAGHIDGAINIDVLDEAGFHRALQQLDPEKPVLVYCQAGGRSLTASKILEAEGFRQILELKVGYQGWTENKH